MDCIIYVISNVISVVLIDITHFSHEKDAIIDKSIIIYVVHYI